MTPHDAVRVLRYRHIDTAALYRNEATVGAALAASGVPRADFFVTTKLWCSDHGAAATRAAVGRALARGGATVTSSWLRETGSLCAASSSLLQVGRSLAALGTPYVDLYLIHAPQNQVLTP